MYFHLTQNHNKRQIRSDHWCQEKYDKRHSRHKYHCSLGVKLKNEM